MPIARTGYTGEPIGFELFPPADIAVRLWKKILEIGEKEGIVPIGLGARDTLRLEAGHPLLIEEQEIPAPAKPGESMEHLAKGLVKNALDNTKWRQKDCVNLIPSEQTLSPLVRLLTIADPSGRYAEHRKVKALKNTEVYYYQGTGFIAEVERELIERMKQFLGCSEVETRLISGQMANTTVFSGLQDYLNRVSRKVEPRRLSHIMNHHIGRGGHLSAQPMGH